MWQPYIFESPQMSAALLEGGGLRPRKGVYCLGSVHIAKISVTVICSSRMLLTCDNVFPESAKEQRILKSQSQMLKVTVHCIY